MISIPSRTSRRRYPTRGLRKSSNGLGRGEARNADEAQSARSAKSKAALLASSKAGVIAFERTGDPSQGEFEPAVVIARYGETPEDLE